MANAKNTSDSHMERSEHKEQKEKLDTSTELVVHQPPKLESLLTVLSDLENITERIGEDRSGDLGSGGAGVSAGSGDDATSVRTKAIKKLPSTEVMRQKLTHHLQGEVSDLEKKARRYMHSATKGSAYALNELYAKIRRIQSLILELIDAAADTVKQLYVRLFIDKQALV